MLSQEMLVNKAAFKHFKRINTALNSLNLIATGLTFVGVTVGGLSPNPVVLGVISVPGLLLEGYLKVKKFDRIVEITKFSYTSYEKVLHNIKAFLRGESYNFDNSNFELEYLYSQVTDLRPLDMVDRRTQPPQREHAKPLGHENPTTITWRN